jgi:hypothetical protein
MIKWNKKNRGEKRGEKKMGGGGGERGKKRARGCPCHNNICITTLYIFMM